MALLMKVWIWSGLFEMMPRKVLQRKHGDNRKNSSIKNHVYTVY
jgi:hypothetical protein